MLTFDVWRNPYNTGVNMTSSKEITLQEGITVLVGCNGAGKTTLLHNIKDYCKKNTIPYHFWDNLSGGGMKPFAEYIAFGDEDSLCLGASLFASSEGEKIILNLEQKTKFYSEFLKSGAINDRANRLANIFRTPEEKTALSEDNRRVFLLDATDSGLSIDNVVMLKDMFRLILDDSKKLGLETYIVISANEYELAAGTDCLDVMTGKYCTFSSYEDFKKFILNSRKKKEKRILREQAYRIKEEEKRQKHIESVKSKYLPKIEEIENRAKEENRPLTWREKESIYNYKSYIRNAENN